MDRYNLSKKMPPKIAAILSSTMREEVGKVISGPLDPPLIIRSGRTVSEVFAPVLENRAGVQICLLGVLGNLRMELIDRIKARIQPDILEHLSIQPGGQYTIDGCMKSLQKKESGKDFMTRFGVDHLFYLGDAVYQKGDKEGNDFSMVHNPNTTVLAVNQNENEVPSHPSTVWLGHGPSATKDWLTYFLIERMNHLKAHDQISNTTCWDVLSYLDLCSEG
jgi:hypothetical protein